MKVGDLSTRPVVSIDAAASLRDAATLMRTEHVGALVVTSGDAERLHAVGVVTDRDLTIEILSRDLPPQNVRVGEIASRKLAAVPADAGIGDAVAAMAEAGVRRLLVTDADGRLAGFVSADDILGALAHEMAGLATAMREGIARETESRQPIAAPHPRPVFLPYGTPGMH